MKKILFRLAFRNIRKQKLYSIINGIGLTIGLWSFVMIMIYVKHERNFDRFNQNYDRIYRLTSGTEDRGPTSVVPYKWGEAIRNDWSEVEQLATILNITIALTVSKDDEVFAQRGIVAVDSSFFKIFDLPIISGDPTKLLRSPNKLVISEEMVSKYFSEQDPVGQVLQINLWGNEVQFEIEGVAKSLKNSHLQFKFLIPMQTARQHFFNPKAFDSWKAHFAYTYILLSNKIDLRSDLTDVMAMLNQILERHGGKEISEKYTPSLQPLKDIYLRSELRSDFQPRGNETNVKILGFVGFGILIMAMINFVNISSAQSIHRLKEFGVKKILGASKASLIFQFMMESILVSITALAFALFATSLSTEGFNNLTGMSIALSEVFSFWNVLIMSFATLLVGVFSGIYPAYILASKKETNILSSRLTIKSGAPRKLLVISQFVMAAILLVATAVVYKQVTFMSKKDLGFSQEQVIVMEDARNVAHDPAKVQLLRESLSTIDQIRFISASSSFPGQTTWASRYIPEGYEKSESLSISTIYADHDFLETYDVEILNGRGFDRSFISDSTAFMINEKAVGLFTSNDPSWGTNPINKKLSFERSGEEGKVIGIFSNFHVGSLKQEIEPMILCIKPQNFFSIQIKVQTEQMASTLQTIESKWKQLFPEVPFTYSFIDQQYGALFQGEMRLSKVLQFFALLSIMIAILGMFGQASMLASEKSREIGIRKVIGASEKQLVIKLSWQFLKLVVIANLIAIPVSIWLTQNWLETYAYRIEMPYEFFALVFAVTVFITILTIIYHTIETALSNPVDVLSQE